MAILAGLSSAATVVTGHSVVEVNGSRGPQAIVGVAADRELLENPGFETGTLPPWVTNAWIVDTKYPHGGTYCADDVGNYWIRQFTDTVPAPEIQSITFWARQPDQPAAQAYDFFYSDGSFEEFVHFPQPAWQQFDVTGQLNRSKSLVGLGIWGYSGGGPGPDSTYVDDVSIQTTEPTREVIIADVISPRDTIPLDSLNTPRVLVHSLGQTSDSFLVVMMIEDIGDPAPFYWDTVPMYLQAGGAGNASFEPWQPTLPVAHRANCWIVLEGNANHDTVRVVFYVVRGTGLDETGRRSAGLRPVPSIGRGFDFGPGSDPVSVYDGAGRSVWRGSGVWHGVDARNVRVRPGVYYARRGQSRVRLVLVR